MANVIIDENTLYGIGDAIRSKTNVNTPYKPSQMAGAIESIETYPEPPGSVSITENGTADVKNYATAIVNVPNSYDVSDEGKVVDNGALVAQTSQTVTQNGTYDTTTNNEVVVNVEGSSSTLVPKTITANGTYNPADDNADGYSEVTVNVSGSNSRDVEPDFSGLSYGYIANDGNFYSSNSKSSCMNFFTVEANKTYILVLGATVSNRNRVHFYSGKTYADFEEYVTASHTNRAIYTCTENINNKDGTAMNVRFTYTPTTDGMLVMSTSIQSVVVPAYCIEDTGYS